MNTPPIMDQIMYWLTPMDSLNLRLTCRAMLPDKILRRHTSPFTHIIPNRPWLMKKISEGYTFTLVCSQIDSLMKAILLPDGVENTGAGLHPGPLSIEALLVVTRKEHVISCSEEFIPLHLFQATGDEQGSDEYADTGPVQYRTVRTARNRLSLTTVMPMGFGELPSPPCIIVPTSVIELPRLIRTSYNGRINFAIAYAHASKDKTIVVPVWHRHGPVVHQMPSKTLFTINTTDNDELMNVRLLFDVLDDKQQQSC